MSLITIIYNLTNYIQIAGNFVIKLITLTVLLSLAPPLILLGLTQMVLSILVPPLRDSARSFFTDYFNMILNKIKGLFKKT